DAAAPGPSPNHGEAGRDGRDHRPAAAGLLRQARHDRGHGRPVGGPRPRPLRPRLDAGEALGRRRGPGQGPHQGQGLSAMDIWDWALAAYGRPGVPEAALALQDKHGQNTSLLLWAVYAEAKDPDLLARAAETTRNWDRLALTPLRDIRRALK